MRPRLLDLFCGAGGAAMGYHRAGFDVVGVDLHPQPNYPFEFHQADALEYLSDPDGVEPTWPVAAAFDAIHASPPCQAYTNMSNRHGRSAYALIPEVRQLLDETGLPYVIENVSGARNELLDPVQVCGRTVGLGIHRHRLFETNWTLMAAACSGGVDEFGIYGRHHDGRRLWNRKDGTVYRAARTLEEAQEAMGMPWADWYGVKEAIPPAYTELIGHQLLSHLNHARGAVPVVAASPSEAHSRTTAGRSFDSRPEGDTDA